MIAAWHVARTFYGGRAEQFLRRLQFEVFSPSVLELRRVPRRRLSASQRHSGLEIRRPCAVPLLPGYLFVRLNLQTSRWREAFNLAGVVGLVVHGGLPAAVDDRLVEHLKTAELRGDMTPRFAFAAGDAIAVEAGPFGGFRGTVEQALDLPLERIDPETRVRVVLHMFGQVVPVTVPHWQLEAS